jgi:hypothetical protein
MWEMKISTVSFSVGGDTQLTVLTYIPRMLIYVCIDILNSGLESREDGRRDSSRLSRDTLSPQKLSLTSPTSGRYSLLAHSGHGIYFFFYFFYSGLLFGNSGCYVD